ncbi:zinc ABC transporter substrate-binding protein [Streptomyces hoynatensis]|uniref:Zinc ABC transporter substrate-binding protein n=2 Tax=Streptomyces hoynatensis TaxID=1141874 RepID=A0A3A9ZBL6_9ACTN|nr:zinc ABC transporter substrate-binding protein [Streptomyces hoynatensis]
MTARRRSRSRIRARITATALAAGATALGLLSVSACGQDDREESADGRLRVIASFYPMEFLAERIGGDHVSVSTLTEPGTEPHDLDLSPQQTARLTEADVIVYLQGLQPAVDEAVAQSGVDHIAEATSFTTLETHGNEVDGTRGAHTDGGHAHEDGEEGGEGGEDPHIWLDPVRFGEVAQGVGEELADADPGHAADYQRNTERLLSELDDLNGEFTQGLADAPERTFITTHAAFGYLAERYGLREEAITGLDPESEPSAARMRDLQDIAEAEGVRTVFFETLVSDETARTLAGDLGLETAVLDPLEGITDESAGADYFEVMRANLAALRQALGATAS